MTCPTRHWTPSTASCKDDESRGQGLSLGLCPLSFEGDDRCLTSSWTKMALSACQGGCCEGVVPYKAWNVGSISGTGSHAASPTAWPAHALCGAHYRLQPQLSHLHPQRLGRPQSSYGDGSLSPTRRVDRGAARVAAGDLERSRRTLGASSRPGDCTPGAREGHGGDDRLHRSLAGQGYVPRLGGVGRGSSGCLPRWGQVRDLCPRAVLRSPGCWITFVA